MNISRQNSENYSHGYCPNFGNSGHRRGEISLFFDIVFLLKLAGGDDELLKHDEREHVGDYHEVVEHVGQLPYEVV